MSVGAVSRKSTGMIGYSWKLRIERRTKPHLPLFSTVVKHLSGLLFTSSVAGSVLVSAAARVESSLLRKNSRSEAKSLWASPEAFAKSLAGGVVRAPVILCLEPRRPRRSLSPIQAGVARLCPPSTTSSRVFDLQGTLNRGALQRLDEKVILAFFPATPQLRRFPRSGKLPASP